MKIFTICLHLLSVLLISCGPSLALDNYCKRIKANVISSDTQTKSLCNSLLKLETSNLSQEETRALRTIMTTQISILDRVKNLEGFYTSLKSVVDWLAKIIDSISKFIGLPTKTNEPTSTTNSDPNLADYHHISGTVMSPGSVAFTVHTGDGLSFDAHDIDQLDMDIYYNKNLFSIDKFVGEGIQGKDYERLTLGADIRSSRDRIKIPLSDVLANKATFYVYLAPANGDLAKVGDQTKINIRYYKRVDAGEAAPLIYELKTNGSDSIKIIAKSPV